MSRAAILLIVACIVCACSKPSGREVVLYSSVDETYARRVAKQFEVDTGIQVKVVSDTEIAKSSGLLLRLLGERTHPIADVFWSGDVARAFALEREGLLTDYTPEDAASLPSNAYLAGNRIIGTAARVRVIIVHESASSVPRTVQELAEPHFASKACLANPLFGTTSVHAAALFRVWGESRAKQFFESFTRNGGTMLASNGEVKRRVGSGEFAFGLTDSDDLHVAWLDGKAVEGIIPDTAENGGLLLPSTAVMIKGAPHREEAEALAAFLSGPRTEKLMADCEAAHLPMRTSIERPERFREASLPAPLDASAWAEMDKWLETLLSGFLREWVVDARRP